MGPYESHDSSTLSPPSSGCPLPSPLGPLVVFGVDESVVGPALLMAGHPAALVPMH